MRSHKIWTRSPSTKRNQIMFSISARFFPYSPNDECTGCSRKKWARTKYPTLLSQMNSWLLNVVYLSKFECCNLEILLLPKISQGTNCATFRWMLYRAYHDVDRLYWFESNWIGEEMCDNHGVCSSLYVCIKFFRCTLNKLFYWKNHVQY